MSDQLLNGNSNAMPDYMKGVGADRTFGEGMDGDGYPRLAFKGSRFRLRQGGEETVLPETELDLIILQDYNAISRIYFAAAYDGQEGGNPSCASADGETPLPSVPNPPSKKCSDCPMNAIGSVLTDDGRKSRACSFYRRMVVSIKGYEDVGPIVTDIRAMSLFGDSKPDKNLWSLKAYFQRLKRNDTQPFQIVTRVTFDTDESVPKLFFSPVGWVDEGSFTEHVAPLINTPDGAQQLLEMADTGKVRFEDDGGSSVQDKLLEQDKPAHLEAPKETVADPENAELTPQQKAAITRKANKAKKVEDAQKAAEALEAEPETVTAPVTDTDLEDVLADFDF